MTELELKVKNSLALSRAEVTKHSLGDDIEKSLSELSAGSPFVQSYAARNSSYMLRNFEGTLSDLIKCLLKDGNSVEEGQLSKSFTIRYSGPPHDLELPPIADFHCNSD